MKEAELLVSSVSEYRELIESAKRDDDERLNMDHLVRHLSHAHDWTEHGACVIVTLANQYGAFMLRNALALAVALDKEDGDLGL